MFPKKHDRAKFRIFLIPWQGPSSLHASANELLSHKKTTIIVVYILYIKKYFPLYGDCIVQEALWQIKLAANE